MSVSPSRDRFRTMVNVMGDALATGIMAHICRKDFVKEGEQVRTQSEPGFKVSSAGSAQLVDENVHESTEGPRGTYEIDLPQ